MDQNIEQHETEAAAVPSPRPALAPTSRRDVLALASQIREQEIAVDARMEDILAHHDVETAAVFALAAIAAGKPPDARLVARLLPTLKDQDDMFPVLVWHAGGDRLAMLLALAESDTMYYERSAKCLFLAMELLGRQEPPRLLALLRHYSRLMDPDALVGHLVGRVQDPVVRQVGAPHLRQAAECRSWVKKEVARLRGRLAAAPLDFLPEEPVRRISGFTVCRPKERVGRNDPCPCGSGQKYKKCCQARDEANPPDPSPVPGLTMSEYRERIHEFLSTKQFRKLQLDEVMQFPLERLPLAYQIEALDLCADLQQWELAEKVLAKIDASAEDREEVERLRVDLLHKTLLKRNVAAVIRQFPLIRDPNQLNVVVLSTIFLMIPRPETVPLINYLVTNALEQPGEVALSAIAQMVMEFFPGLGLTLSRGALTEADPERTERLLSCIEQARDKLNLPAGDRYAKVWGVMQDLDQARRMRTEGEQQLEKERERLRLREAAMDERLRLMAAREEERERRLQQTEQALLAARESAEWNIDPAEHRRLLRKLARLKDLLAESHRERAELRQALAAYSDRSAAPTPMPVATEQEKIEDEDEGPGEQAEERRQVLLPVLSRAARDALLSLPAHVARKALLTVARLSGGDPVTWAASKRLKETPLWSVRVALRYRLLFRPEERRLEVLDLRHRRLLPMSKRRILGSPGGAKN